MKTPALIARVPAVVILLALAGPVTKAADAAGGASPLGAAAVTKAADAAGAGKGGWACPPCGALCDRDAFDKAGACPHCGMPLVTNAEAGKLRTRQAAGRSEAQRRALVLVFPGVQIIDFTGPYEVLGQAGLQVDTVAEKAGPIVAAMGLVITPAFTLANAPKAEVLVVPGGGVDSAQDSPAVQAWLRAAATDAEVVLSVCNGAFILAKAGLLDGLSATTFAGLIEPLRSVAPKTRVVDDRRYVDNGKVITSAGLSSGLDGALHVVEKLYGKGTAQKVATNLEYDWDPDGSYVRAQLADRHLNGLYRRLGGYEREIVSHEGGRDRWENRWVVKGASAGELLESVKSALPKGEAGKDVSRPDGRLETAFSFTDPRGARWSGLLSLAPRADSAVELTVTIRKQWGNPFGVSPGPFRRS